MRDGTFTLSDRQLRSYVARGVLLVDTSSSFDAAFHDAVASSAQELAADEPLAVSNIL